MNGDKQHARNRERRSRILVDPTFQFGLLARLVLYFVMYHFALWHVVFAVTFVSTALNAGAPRSGFWTMYGRFAVDHAGVALCFLGLLPVFIGNMLKFSHRLAGPLVRIRKTLQVMSDGKPIAPVKLREHDLLSCFVASFNRMAEVWNSRFAPAASEELEEVEAVTG